MSARNLSMSLGIWVAACSLGCSSNNAASGNPGASNAGATGGATAASTTTGSVGGSTTGTGSGGATGVLTSGGTTGVSGSGGKTFNLASGGTSGLAITGGAPDTGGATSVVATGGLANTGGAKSTGGTKATSATGGISNATGGKASAGGNPSTGGSVNQSTNCTISATSSTSTTIGSVGIVTFTSSLTSIDGAHIDFGLDTNYGMTAPVELTATNYRTLLLGMKAAHTYHFRVVAQSGSTQCTSSDYTITTGAAPNAIKKPTITSNNKNATYGGFLVMEGYRANTPDDYAFILDADGDIVWWYHPTGFSDLTATRMSYDGKYMWIAHGNVPSGTAHVGRVTMDGATFDDYSTQFKNQNHDLTVLPNDAAVIFIAYNSSAGCDDIIERAPDGTLHTIINSGKAFGNATACHCNAIQYSSSDNTVVVSDDDHSGYFKVDRQGSIKWVLNGGTSNSFDKSGGGATGWTGNHNLHILGADHILFFNNGTASTMSTGQPSVARELQLNLTSMTTSQIWSYTANPTISNAVMGDVQRLDNGNTIIAYSTQGVIHEVDAGGALLQQLSWGLQGAFGYITKRKTLYGPPPK